MISVDEAYRFIDSCSQDFGTETVALLSSLHRILAIDVKADRDFPPYDRVTMDGIAVSSNAYGKGQRQFSIEKISAAGSPVQTLDNTNNCIEVMTGTMLPVNTNAVIPYEQCEISENTATVNSNDVQPFQNIHCRGTDEKEGAVLLQKNTRISPAHISLMATVGMKDVHVYKLPLVAVCSTGDELIAIDQTPLPHQVRQSNVYLLAADLEREKIQPRLFHLPDDKERMKALLEDILQHHDVVLLSGAVSKGKFDFLPDVLASLGMKTIFHRIAQRPGKPFLLGAIGEKMIFGFPGNPVSTFVCYHLFFRRWLRRSLHQTMVEMSAVSATDIALSSPLTNHVLVKISYHEGRCMAEPVSFSTSGDIPSLLYADGIITLPAKKNICKGEIVEVVLCR